MLTDSVSSPAHGKENFLDPFQPKQFRDSLILLETSPNIKHTLLLNPVIQTQLI